MIRYQRQFQGPLEAVIMDLAGTCVDYGSLAPILAFFQLFEQQGIPVTEAEARAPMGTEKRIHISQMLAMPRIATAWQERFGQLPTEADIDRLYQTFLPLQLATIKTRTQAIAGLFELIDFCNNHDMKVAVNTGYNREMAEQVLHGLANQGFHPVSSVCATEVPKGRPWPHMSLKNAIELGVSDVRACIKIDDTETGIEEGLAAGMWTVAVALSGNAVGVDLETWNSFSAEEQQYYKERAYSKLHRSGAHYVIDSIAELPAVIEVINGQLANGVQP